MTARSSGSINNVTFQMVEKLDTPFGDIRVRLNSGCIPFRFRTESYEDDDYAMGKPILMRIIDIDLVNMKEDDMVICGFDSDILEYNDADERSVIYSCEDDKKILGLCAFAPDDKSAYCYWLVEYGNSGFGYRVTANPSQFGNRCYSSRIISLAVSWLDKADYKDADLVTFLALTSVIG